MRAEAIPQLEAMRREWVEARMDAVRLGGQAVRLERELKGARDTIAAKTAAIHGLNATVAQMLANPVTVINENSAKQEQLRDQADAWYAVCKQLRGDNAYDPALPPNCGRNGAVRDIQELQEKARQFDYMRVQMARFQK